MNTDIFHPWTDEQANKLFQVLRDNQKQEKGQERLAEQYSVIIDEDREAVDFVQLNIEHGPWIAGGSVIQWFQNKPVGMHDIDVFFRSESQFIKTQNFIHAQDKSRWDVRHVSENAVTYEIRSRAVDKNSGHTVWSLQLIKHKYFSSIQDIFDHFDLSVCQIATDGKQFVLGEHAGVDIKQRNLRFVSDYKADSLKRFVKYVSYGYKPIDGTLQAIIANPKTKYEFDLSGEYNNAF